MYEQLEQKSDQKSQAPKRQQIQRKEEPNRTGLPDNLKEGIQRLSGYDMGDVKVHYNSSKPAQLNAHAYAQGTQIHLGAGQERHLPHEAWHVVQQKQGRVKPTMSFNGQAINDNVGLEREADVMGGKALQMRKNNNNIEKRERKLVNSWIQLKPISNYRELSNVLQMRTAVGYVGHFANRHIYVGATDLQARERAASRSDPATHNHVLTDTNAARNTAFEDQLTLECADEAKLAGHEFTVNTPAKKASKARNDEHPDSTAEKPISKRRYVGNYDLTATVTSITAVLDSGIEQNADIATIKTIKD